MCVCVLFFGSFFFSFFWDKTFVDFIYLVFLALAGENYYWCLRFIFLQIVCSACGLNDTGMLLISIVFYSSFSAQ